MRKHMKRLLALLLVVTVSITTMDLNTYAQVMEKEATTEQTATISENAETYVSGNEDTSVSENEETTVSGNESVEPEENGWDGTTMESVYEGEGYKVTFTLSSYWEGGYNANVKVENISNETIQDWYLKFNLSNQISNIWNAEIYQQEDAEYIIKNAGWNQDIQAGNFVEFGISANENFGGFPAEYEIISTKSEKNTEKISIEYNLDSDWDSGFTGTISITNNSENVLEDWVLEFDFDRNITSMWNGVVESHEGNHYIIKNVEYNANIASGQSISFGFSGNDGSKELVPTNYRVYSYDDNNVKEPLREKEPLESIGEAYFKAPTKEEVVFDAETGLQYAKNQILISALPGAPKSVFEQIAMDINAEIVGYIELTNDYQLEFHEDKTIEELENIIAYIDSFSFVSYVSLNLVHEVEEVMVTTNDALYNDGKTRVGVHDINKNDIWDEQVPDGDNWGLEALRVPGAWGKLKTNNPVKVGLLDNMFDENHSDLIFDDIVNNPSDITSKHGTHVAGIMAAQSNNRIGISGVATNTRLYACSMQGIHGITSSIESKYRYAVLIGNHVKVINVSYGYKAHITYAASHGVVKAQNYINEEAKIMEEFLDKLIVQGYDFLITVAANNYENTKMVKDSGEQYGYRKYDSKRDSESDIVSGNVKALYGYYLNAITNECVKGRIIVVGSVRHLVTISGTTSYYYSDFSQIGERVDVCAPGEDILSCAPYSINSSEYELEKGTSMASPYIAGIAALMYQTNPGITAPRVKKIICDSRYTYVKDVHGNSYGMPDASVCIDKANNTVSLPNTDIDYPSGILTGNITDSEKSPVKNVKITACRTNTGDSNLDDYYTIAATDDNGNYEIVLRQGTYDLRIYAEGYMPYVIKGVVINPNETTYMENIIIILFNSDYLFAELSGKVVNALNGSAVHNATVKLRKGWNNTGGNYVTDISGQIKSTLTNGSGAFDFSVPIGTYTAEIVREGYITGYCNVVAMSNLILTYQTVVLTPVLPDDEYRIVLTWGDFPNDLDSHLTYYTNGTKYLHAYYSSRSAYFNGQKIMYLDMDDTTSYGPETITVSLKEEYLQNGEFKYSVHNYTNRGSLNSFVLSSSNAVVHVYKGNELLKTYHIPKNNVGTVWHVFDLTKNGIVSYNEFTNVTNPEYVN